MDRAVLLVLAITALALICVIAYILLCTGEEARSVMAAAAVPAVSSAAPPPPVPPYMLGDDGETPPPMPPDEAARNEPELYAEYMSPHTSAIRKTEVGDILAGMGYTLPYQRDLHRQYLREMEALRVSSAEETETPPFQDTPYDDGEEFRDTVEETLFSCIGDNNEHI